MENTPSHPGGGLEKRIRLHNGHCAKLNQTEKGKCKKADYPDGFKVYDVKYTKFPISSDVEEGAEVKVNGIVTLPNDSLGRAPIHTLELVCKNGKLQQKSLSSKCKLSSDSYAGRLGTCGTECKKINIPVQRQKYRCNGKSTNPMSQNNCWEIAEGQPTEVEELVDTLSSLNHGVDYQAGATLHTSVSPDWITKIVALSSFECIDSRIFGEMDEISPDVPSCGSAHNTTKHIDFPPENLLCGDISHVVGDKKVQANSYVNGKPNRAMYYWSCNHNKKKVNCYAYGACYDVNSSGECARSGWYGY